MRPWPTIAATCSASTSRRPSACGTSGSTSTAPPASPTRPARSSDPTRLIVAAALAGADELCVCDLAWVAERAENLVSHHARALRSLGLAESRRDGKMVLYRLTDRGRVLLEAVLDEGVRA